MSDQGSANWCDALEWVDEVWRQALREVGSKGGRMVVLVPASHLKHDFVEECAGSGRHARSLAFTAHVVGIVAQPATDMVE